jgi:hypothetical protein
MIIVANKLYQLQKAPKGDSKSSALNTVRIQSLTYVRGLEIRRELKKAIASFF